MEKSQLLLWDFSIAMLHHPKTLLVCSILIRSTAQQLRATARQRSSIVTTSGRHRTETLASSRVRYDSNRTDNKAFPQDSWYKYMAGYEKETREFSRPR
ncbi:hypothetical protein BDDG_02026 [Blastomyces dermatitidis ATCC 18188]|uniref:Uncharacterized protein n=1 Tax=Ajellomyces dermatitidis (strain ATCC 18188 / CBS 674.68) TaxID=653446 RepID=F2T775_AJEDA|nr:hypothetical protein BDDG_02026 [Blastomyces dermatitidis ATCC 18188]